MGDEAAGKLRDKRAAIVGRLTGMTHSDAVELLRRHGAAVLDRPDATADLIVVGEEGLPISESNSPNDGFDGRFDDWFDDAIRAAVEGGRLEVIAESQLWQRLGLADQRRATHSLYTPAMLAKLLGVSVDVVRRWHRRKLILPAQEVRRLPYFDFHEVATARRLAELLAAGMSPQKIEKKLAELARLLPGVERPLAQLSVIVQGKDILLRQGGGLIEPGGQLRFNFDNLEMPSLASPGVEPPATAAGVLRSVEDISVSPEQMRAYAAELEDAGRLSEAADMHRAAMAAAGPDAGGCFQLAELLYRQCDLTAARERYSMAIELDEDYVEARANLGCVLAELGQRELAVAAFEGALRYHPGYADVYYHLARTLDEMGHRRTAERHWRTFATLAPDSPWAAEAAERMK